MENKIKKINIELALSRKFQKVTLTMLDEEIEYENMEDLSSKIQNRMDFLEMEIEKEFGKIIK